MKAAIESGGMLKTSEIRGGTTMFVHGRCSVDCDGEEATKNGSVCCEQGRECTDGHDHERTLVAPSRTNSPRHQPFRTMLAAVYTRIASMVMVSMVTPQRVAKHWSSTIADSRAAIDALPNLQAP